MKKIFVSLLLCMPALWAAADEKKTVVKVEHNFDIDHALQVLNFCQQAKAHQSYPDAFTPNRVTTTLERLHIKDPSAFERVYAALTAKVLAWTEQHLLEDTKDN